MRLRQIQGEVYKLHLDMVKAGGGYDKLADYIIKQSQGKNSEQDPTLHLAAVTHSILGLIADYSKFLKAYDEEHRNPNDPKFVGSVGNLVFFAKKGWPPKFKVRKVK